MFGGACCGRSGGRQIIITRIAAMRSIFTRIGCTLFTCDMYMCRLRHINDSVLSSLKMKGIFFYQCLYDFIPV
jgi:hypothetical protein